MAKGRSLSGTRPRPSSQSSIRSTTSTLALPLSSTSFRPLLPPTSSSTTRRGTAAAAAAAPASDAAMTPSRSPPPRRRVIILPGLGNCDADYSRLAELLRSRGAAVKVARVARIDWARNAAGLLIPDYWQGTLSPRPTVDWYLGRIDEALEALNEEVSRHSKYSSESSAGGGNGNGGDAGSISSSSSPSLPPLTLLAHSAGGWLGRVWMLSEDKGTGKEKAALVSDFVCVFLFFFFFFFSIFFLSSSLFLSRGPRVKAHSLSFLPRSFFPLSPSPPKNRSVGSPHRPPPPGSSIPDQTRGILTWVERESPGDFHSREHGVRYTTVASKFVKGAPLFGSGSSAEEDEEEEEERTRGETGSSSSGTSFDDSNDSDIALLAPAPNSSKRGTRKKISIAQRLAGFGYEAVCGDSEAWGDGITPVASSHLPGALTLTLEGVFHSPLGADDDDGEGGEGGEGGIGTRPWYGSARVLDQWVGAVFGETPVV